MKNESNLIHLLFFFLSIFSFSGCYFAESDNDILRKELSVYTGQEVRK